MRFFQGGEATFKRPFEHFWDVSMARAITIGSASVLATRKTGQYYFSDHTLPPKHHFGHRAWCDENEARSDRLQDECGCLGSSQGAGETPPHELLTLLCQPVFNVAQHHFG